MHLLFLYVFPLCVVCVFLSPPTLARFLLRCIQCLQNGLRSSTVQLLCFFVSSECGELLFSRCIDMYVVFVMEVMFVIVSKIGKTLSKAINYNGIFINTLF